MRQSLENLSKPHSGICVGLDPDIEKFPIEFDSSNPKQSMQYFLKEIIELTLDYACAYKLQKAFFDLYDFGHTLLKKTIDYIRKKDSSKPIFIDSKIGDIDNTMNAYLKNLFEVFDADGITVNPYMGHDVFKNFDKYADRGILLLVRTSNQNAKVMQDIYVDSMKKKHYWEHVLDTALEFWNLNNNIIPVLSDNANSEKLRLKLGNNIPVLYAGVGSQKGNLQGIKNLLNDKKSGVFVNSSRKILYPYDTEDVNWREKVHYSIEELMYNIDKIKNE